MFKAKQPKQFRTYKDAKSKVAEYELAQDGITVRFKDHTVYRYTNQSAGPANIAKLKAAAPTGKGLDALLDAVKDRHSHKIR